MSPYTESVTRSRHHVARYAEEPSPRSADLVLYQKESPHHHHHRHRSRHRKDPVLIRSRSLHRRESSSDDDVRRRPRRKSVVVRPRSASRVRIVDPALLVDTSSCSSSDEGRHGRRHKHHAGDTHIRATSRPGKKNNYAFVRHPPKSRRKSDAKLVVRDVEVETDHHHHHRDFQHRRDALEDREAAVLIRSKSREREGFMDDDDSTVGGYYEQRRHRSSYAGGGGHHRRRSTSDERREFANYQGSHGRGDYGRSTRDSRRHGYGSGLGHADDERESRADRHGPRQRRFSLSPDGGSVYSSKADGSVRGGGGAFSTTSFSKHSRSHAYEGGSVAGSETSRHHPQRDSGYPIIDDNNRRERDLMEREKRLRREEAALDKEKRLADRGRGGGGGEMELPFRGIIDRDPRKVYKTGSGLINGAKKLLS